MSVLANLSRWLLQNSQTKAKWGIQEWQKAFEACGSPREWQEFVARHGTEPWTEELLAEARRLSEDHRATFTKKVSKPVELPAF